MLVVLVVPCPLALRVWWSWHGVDVCGRWWLTGLTGQPVVQWTAEPTWREPLHAEGHVGWGRADG